METNRATGWWVRRLLVGLTEPEVAVWLPILVLALVLLHRLRPTP